MSPAETNERQPNKSTTKMRAGSTVRYGISWLVLVLGLAGVLGGGVMLYAAYLDPTYAAKHAKEEADFKRSASFEGRVNLPVSKMEVLERFGPGAASILVGGIFVVVGICLRPSATKPAMKKRKKADRGLAE